MNTFSSSGDGGSGDGGGSDDDDDSSDSVSIENYEFILQQWCGDGNNDTTLHSRLTTLHHLWSSFIGSQYTATTYTTLYKQLQPVLILIKEFKSRCQPTLHDCTLDTSLIIPDWIVTAGRDSLQYSTVRTDSIDHLELDLGVAEVYGKCSVL